jgi:plasmid maintenance system antidote protein VapI
MVLWVTRVALSAFLNGTASLSPDTAVRIDKAFGVAMETLMRMQNSFDTARTRPRESEIAVQRYVPTKTREAKAKACLIAYRRSQIPGFILSR